MSVLAPASPPPRLHLVLEDDLADDDGARSGELSNEAQSCCRGSNVARANFGPTRLGVKVYEQAESQRHQEHAKVDGRKKLSRLADEDTGANRGKRERQCSWEERGK
ncbi:hypothetical protein KC349_g231 [Hortaea werneckii]|nr:hypothetical protein KC349_g231 [Hortaea werneckii]